MMMMIGCDERNKRIFACATLKQCNYHICLQHQGTVTIARKCNNLSALWPLVLWQRVHMVSYDNIFTGSCCFSLLLLFYLFGWHLLLQRYAFLFFFFFCCFTLELFLSDFNSFVSYSNRESNKIVQQFAGAEKTIKTFI